jgi:putative Mn2+ efflux pump MntP
MTNHFSVVVLVRRRLGPSAVRYRSTAMLSYILTVLGPIAPVRRVRESGDRMLSLALTAVALGLSNFGAAIAIGLAGVDAALRVRVTLVFGVFEAGMPVLGLLVGHHLAASFGSASTYVGGGLLIATGAYAIRRARRAHPAARPATRRVEPLLATGAAASLDNLVVGFALGTHRVSLAVAVPVIALTSVGMALAGLELGRRLGTIIEVRSEELSGVVLILVGVAIAFRLF